MVRVIRVPTVLGLIVLLGACAVAYEEPLTSSSATLAFRNDTQGYVPAHMYGEPNRCTSSRVVGMLEPGTEKVVNVKANELVSFQAAYLSKVAATGTGLEVKNCVFIGSFMPRAKASYAVTVSTTGQACRLHVLRDIGGRLESEPTFLLRQYTVPTLGSDPQCPALSDSDRDRLAR
jgi:hypothetical protein